MSEKCLALWGSLSELQDFFFASLPQCYDPFECLLTSRGRLRNASKKELDPVLYVVRGSYSGQRVIVCSSIPLKKIR